LRACARRTAEKHAINRHTPKTFILWRSVINQDYTTPAKQRTKHSRMIISHKGRLLLCLKCFCPHHVVMRLRSRP